jgi:fatty acid desaturase
MFRYAEDRLPVALFSLYFAIDIAVYLLVDDPLWLVLWFGLSIVPKGAICAWNHHHQHLSVFRAPALNRVLELMYGLQTGIMSHAWVLHHSVGHHVNYLDQRADESRWRRDDSALMGETEYSLVVGITAYVRAFRVGARFPNYRRTFVWMSLLTIGVAVSLTIYRPLPGLFVFVLPMIAMLFLTAWATYTHHAGKSTANHFVASNNILHRGYNIMTGNLGYHTAHHYKPGVHWSRLPELHASIAHLIPADCYLSPGLPWAFGQKIIGPPKGMAFAQGASIADDCEPTVKWSETSVSRPNDRAVDAIGA